MKRLCIALVGDYSLDVPAHRAIPKALELASAAIRQEVVWRWVHTSEIHDPARDLSDCAAVWVVPASPYANMAGVLDAIHWARETGRPFLGTCGGFQHALIEFARNVAGLPGAEHAETSKSSEILVVTPLSCSLVEKAGVVYFAPDSQLSSAYGKEQAIESYRCNYGLNPAYRPVLEAAGLRFTAFDDAGDVRAAELSTHPFFVGTLFQPERAALRGDASPLVSALVRAMDTR